jgi:hypothetical protein
MKFNLVFTSSLLALCYFSLSTCVQVSSGLGFYLQKALNHGLYDTFHFVPPYCTKTSCHYILQQWHTNIHFAAHGKKLETQVFNTISYNQHNLKFYTA